MVDYLRMQGMLHPQGLLGEPTACSCLHQNAHAWLVADGLFWRWQVPLLLSPAAAEPAGMLGADSSLCTAAVADYAEQKLFAPLSLDPPKDRLSNWQQLGWRHPNLEDSILAANPSWQADMIPAK